MNTETTRKSNDAWDYAQVIKKELINLETLLENAHELDGSTPDSWLENNDDDPELTDNITTALDDLGYNWSEGLDDFSPLICWLNETLLECEALYSTAREFRRLEMLRTCGGPYCRIIREANDGDRLTIEVTSGSDQHTQPVWLSCLADELDALYPD